MAALIVCIGKLRQDKMLVDQYCYIFFFNQNIIYSYFLHLGHHLFLSAKKKTSLYQDIT